MIPAFTAERMCGACGGALVRRAKEAASLWASRRFCSRACANDAQRPKETKVCPQCKATFLRQVGRVAKRWQRQVYCSRACCAIALRGTHGACGTPEFAAWSHMLGRCFNERSDDYANYGGRGITVCARWRGSFEAFLADMGTKPSVRHSLDRYPDNNGNYEPGNCRWATPKQQARNTRRSRMVRYLERELSLVEWVEVLGVNYDRAKKRLNAGLPPEEAFEGKVPCLQAG